MKASTGSLVLILMMTGLTACGGSGSAPVADTGPASFGLLKPAESEQELAQSMQAGLQDASYVTAGGESAPVLFALDQEVAGVASPGSAGGSNYSTTNLQEVGVDEADLVKYDGEILYVLDSSGQYGIYSDDSPLAGISFAQPRSASIALLRTDPDTATASEVARIDLTEENIEVEGIYLRTDGASKQLVSVGSSSEYFSWSLFASDYYWREGETSVQGWDVSDPESPSAAWSLNLEGSLLATRRIGDSLYLLTRYSPRVDGVIAYPQTEQEVADNQKIIDATPLADLLPKIIRSEDLREPLLTATDCYVPNQSYTDGAVLPSGGSLITVTEINLAAPQQMRSICLNAWSSGFYASTQAIYVTASGADNTTLIHKIALTGAGPEYRGSGSVEGYLGTSNPAFLMSEFEGDLRVVSSRWDNVTFPLPILEVDVVDAAPPAEEEADYGRHRLTVLRESADGTRLDTVSRLPNEQRPEHIGKPGEDVYAARFLGERGFVVTFEVIDPLYVLDLSDPLDPLIAGELEIPGFSTLLQPLGENLLLGVGQDVPDTELNLTQGIKVALFDVADITSPISLGEVVIGKRGSYSPALYDHQALTLLPVESGFRVAVPVERYATPHFENNENSAWAWYEWSDSGLYLFDIDIAAGSLQQSGSLINATRDEGADYYNNVTLYRSRAVLHENAVFFLVNGELYSRLWVQ